jgi:putative transposase
MPWQETEPMTERLQCMAAYLHQGDAMTELCERFGLRRNTGDTWVRRDTAPGLAGLQEQSRAPHRCPHRLSAEVEAILLEAKRAHLHWGPRQSLPYLAPPRPALDLPAPSTAGELCPRAGCSHARTRRRGHRHPGASPLPADTPKAVWTADCKGQCRPGAGLYGSPLPVADAYSRLRFSGSARLSTKPAAARPLCERRFREYGLPDASRPDHGAPCAPPAFCGLSQLSVWWITLGIRHQRRAPGRPEQNGRHERLHRTLKADATRPPASHQQAPQARVERCCREDHAERPHDALHSCTPASLDRPSARPLPATLPPPAYPGHSLVRRVSTAGTFRFQTRQLCIRDTLLQEDMALEETADGIGSISCYDVLLARLDERDCKLYA